MRIWHKCYREIIALENVFTAWDEFLKGKRAKADVIGFQRTLEDNLFELHEALENKTYRHGEYQEFYVHDPKMRHIHKAGVKDRVVHHLVSKKLEKIFDNTFYAHSYSCRKGKGTHKAVKAFITMARKASKNNSSKLFVLKCDVKKFFASVDHEVLLSLLAQTIQDTDFLWLLDEIIRSFTGGNSIGQGMPIGNLTSQLFANIYMHPLDQYVKHHLREQYYIRYADDFVILSNDPKHLQEVLRKIESFLQNELKLSLHANKVHIQNYYQGIDFLGYVVFPHFVIPRTKTKRRIFKKLKKQAALIREGRANPETLNQVAQSYLGHLTHCNGFKLSQELRNQVLFLSN